MNKETILKSVHIAFNDAGWPEVQLQRLERVSFEGELIREMYLPHERFSLSKATGGELAALGAAISLVTASQGRQIDELTVQIDELTGMLEQERADAAARFGQVVLERDKVVAQAGELAVQLEVARAEVQP